MIEYPLQFPGDDANDNAWKHRVNKDYDHMLNGGMKNNQLFDWYFSDGQKQEYRLDDLADHEQN